MKTDCYHSLKIQDLSLVLFNFFFFFFGGSLESLVDWLFLPQNFGPVVGTYEGLLRLCEWDIGWGLYFQVVGTQALYVIIEVFSATGGGGLKTQYNIHLAPLTPSCPLSLPSLPLAPLAPSHSFLPLAPTAVVGTQKHSITYPYPTLAIGSERE